MSLGQGEGQKPKKMDICVKTIFISHPDLDHYNWISKIFHEEDIIENIILGGLPQEYDPSFRAWLTTLVNRTNIYFPAIICPQPITSLESVLKEAAQKEYAPQLFSDPITGKILGDCEHLKDFQKAFPFGENAKTYLLTANPTHAAGTNRMLRRCNEDDSNSDSLVVKLKIGDYSIDIMGDATSQTTDCILDNYLKTDFLNNTTVTLAAHHGSYTHGSNNEDWIKGTNPFYVIFSCGTLHNHPALATYEKFKKSTNLAYTPKHKLWVWEKVVTVKKEPKKTKGKRKAKKETKKELKEIPRKGVKAIVHSTHQGLFSTFNEGSINIQFFNNHLRFKSKSTEFMMPKENTVKPLTVLSDDPSEEEILLDSTEEEDTLSSSEEHKNIEGFTLKEESHSFKKTVEMPKKSRKGKLSQRTSDKAIDEMLTPLKGETPPLKRKKIQKEEKISMPNEKPAKKKQKISQSLTIDTKMLQKDLPMAKSTLISSESFKGSDRILSEATTEVSSDSEILLESSSEEQKDDSSEVLGVLSHSDSEILLESSSEKQKDDSSDVLEVLSDED